MEICLGDSKLKIEYSVYSKRSSFKCPFCQFRVNHKTKTFRSLKQLTHHLATYHSSEPQTYPFSLDEIRGLVMCLAKSIEWKLIE